MGGNAQRQRTAKVAAIERMTAETLNLLSNLNHGRGAGAAFNQLVVGREIISEEEQWRERQCVPVERTPENLPTKLARCRRVAGAPRLFPDPWADHPGWVGTISSGLHAFADLRST